MFGIDDLMIYTIGIGGAALTGEILKIAIGKSKNKTGELATSKFGLTKDLKDLIGNDGFKISKNLQFSEKVSQENICIIGATGTGKTTSFFYPNLLENSLRGSIVTMDPKRELYKDTKKYQESIGRRVLLFCPLDPTNSIHYNPLEQCKDTTEVTQLAQLILLSGSKSLEIQTGVKAGGIEWVNMCIPLFTAALLYSKSKGKYFNNITNAVRLLINNPVEDLKVIFENEEEEIQEQFNIFMQAADSPKTAASIKSTLANNVQLFLDKKIIEVTKDSDFCAEDLRNNKIALYISYTEIKSAYLSPFMSIFFSQIIGHLYETKNNKNPIHFYFDEFSNTGVIANISAILATSRSRKLSFLVCLQSLSQLLNLYGEQNTKSILNNLKTKCILSSISDTETLNYISGIVGDTSVQIKNKSIIDNKTSYSYSNQVTKLMAADEIRRLDKEEILIVAHNKQPIKTMQNIYYKNPEYMARIG